MRLLLGYDLPLPRWLEGVGESGGALHHEPDRIRLTTPEPFPLVVVECDCAYLRFLVAFEFLVIEEQFAFVKLEYCYVANLGNVEHDFTFCG